MTDEEIDVLAREVLAKFSQFVKSWDESPIASIKQLDDGEEVLTYDGVHSEYGGFSCDYFPLNGLKQLIRECEQLFDAFYVEFKNEGGEPIQVNVAEKIHNRDGAIRTMVESGAVHMFAYFRGKMQDTLVEAYQDGIIVAKTILQAATARSISEEIPDTTADMRKEIAEAAKRVADKKQKILTDHVSRLPFVLAQRGRGAPKKSASQREQEGHEYAARVEAAYRKIRKEIGKPPTKTLVAKEIIGGGISPSGTDSNLTAFGNKLRTLKVNYWAIVDKIESELNE